MRYQGGKSKIGKTIAPLLIKALHAGTGYYAEPFLGAAGVARHVAPHALGMFLSDASEDLMLMWRALANGWAPPTAVSEERYAELRHAEPSPERAHAGYAASFGGKWFGGYGRGHMSRDLASGALQQISADLSRCALVIYQHASYEHTNVHTGETVYCDPPYEGTLGYARVGAFDSGKFWDTMQAWDDRHAFVFVSEFTAPEGWVPVWAKVQNMAMRGSRRDGSKIDQLFCTSTVAQLLGLDIVS